MPKNKQNVSAFERNRSYLNLDGQTFLDFSFASGCDIDADSRSVVAADFDRDGATDLLVGSVGGGPLRLFLNRFPTENRSLRIELIGTENNQAGIGARVTAFCEGRRITRDVFPANGCLGQAPAELNLGVGNAEVIDRLTVRWPNGKTAEYRDISVDGVVTIRDDESAVQYRSLESRL